MGVYEKFFFTILNYSKKLVILRWKIVFSNFLYQQGDPNDRELFQISNYFMWEKHIENAQFLTLSIHTFSITNLEKSLHHSDLPIDIKKLLHIIFQLSVTVYFKRSERADMVLCSCTVYGKISLYFSIILQP